MTAICRLSTSRISSRPFTQATLRFSTFRKYSSIPDKWNYNRVSFIDSSDSDHTQYDLVTAKDLDRGSTPPRRVKMLVRDFIEDSLYNPNYGYFSKHATILDTLEQGYDFSSLTDLAEFQEQVAKRYAVYGRDQQLWHTPSELFKPWYGRAIAQCLVSEYLLKYYPYEDFIIYEIGAGNGTLALDILNYLQEDYPEVYDRTRYNIIEISHELVQKQKNKLGRRHACVKVEHESIFHWKIKEPAPCFFVALEVIDNFAHDLIRYDIRTLEPYHALVAIDGNGDFEPFYTKITDPLISSFLELRQRLSHSLPLPRLFKSSTLRTIFTHIPFAPNLSKPEYIPTMLLSFLRTLRSNFPRHRLLLSDFSSLPNTIPGVNAPVVQTRYRDAMIPCSTLFVKQGHFDIFFPTNFERLRDMYEDVFSHPYPSSSSSSSPLAHGELLDPSRTSPLMMSASSLSLGADFFSSHMPSNRRTPVDGVASASGLPVGERKSSVFTHAEFVEMYAELTKTRLRNGENPMLECYKNVKFLF